MEEQTIVEIRRLTQKPNTPVEATSDAASIGDDERSLKEILFDCALLDRKWDKARAIFDKYPHMVRIPLKDFSKNTALHIAVMNNSSTFVKELVKLEYMTAKDLEIPNGDGNTAFHVAVIQGNDDFIQIMIKKNENLPMIRGQDEMLPVQLAVLFFYNKIAEYLTSDNLLEKMASKDWKDIERLFFMTVNSSMYDVALKLLKKYPKELVSARNDKGETTLHMLARLPSEAFDMRGNYSNSPRSLLVSLSIELGQLGHHGMKHEVKQLITYPSVVMFDSIKSRNAVVAEQLLYMSPEVELLTIKDPENGRNLLHFAVLYRQQRIFNFIIEMDRVNHIVRAVDKDGNNILHLAAHLPPEEMSSSSRPNIQMQEELEWFKEMKRKVPPELRTMRNRDGKTPKELFDANHRNLFNEVKEAAKGIANSSMVVAALVATVAFAAALTVPGDKNNDGFIVFILTNAVALFTSSASIISFLSIFTSPRFTERQLIFSLHPSLFLGLTLLFISIVTMVIAFAAASFLIFGHKYKWVAYVVASLGLLPILTILLLQSTLFDALLDFLPEPVFAIYSKVRRMVQLASRIICRKREATSNSE